MTRLDVIAAGGVGTLYDLRRLAVSRSTAAPSAAPSSATCLDEGQFSITEALAAVSATPA